MHKIATLIRLLIFSFITLEISPLYLFQKAILESESEWAQNKKLVDTREKGLRGSIPKGLPYFNVEFGLDGGYAHVIEDEYAFPHYFGKVRNFVCLAKSIRI